MPSVERRAGLQDGGLLRLRTKRIAPYAVILAAAAYFLFLTGRFDYDKAAGSLGPDAWPRLILLLLIAACVSEIVRVALFWRGDEAAPADLELPDSALPTAEDFAPAPTVASFLQAALALASIALYLLVFGYLGFFLATFLFLMAFPAILGYRNGLVILPVAALLTTGFMFLFMRMIYVSLPIGIEPFARVSLLLMRLLGVS